jgi:hypothetical protein
MDEKTLSVCLTQRWLKKPIVTADREKTQSRMDVDVCVYPGIWPTSLPLSVMGPNRHALLWGGVL